MKNKSILTLLAGSAQSYHPGSTDQDFISIWQSYLQKEPRINFGPPAIYLEAVRGCPFSCITCKPEPARPQRVSQKLLEQIEPFMAGLEVLTIHGQGDPLLADLEYFVYQSVENDFVLQFDTSGFLLTEKIADLLLKTRISAGFLLPAARPETYYRMTGFDLDRVKDGIKALVEKGQSSAKNHDFHAKFTVIKENLDEVEDFLRIAHECGIRVVHFMHLWPGNETLKGITARGFTFKYSEQFNSEIRRQFAERVTDYISLASELNIRIEWKGNRDEYSRTQAFGRMVNNFSNRLLARNIFPLKHPGGPCAAPWFGQLSIAFNGDVSPCCLSPAILGKLYDSSLGEVWQGRYMTRLRQAFHRGRFPHECGYCPGFGIDSYPANSFAGIERQKKW